MAAPKVITARIGGGGKPPSVKRLDRRLVSLNEQEIDEIWGALFLTEPNRDKP